MDIDIDHLAHLAKLRLTPEQKKMMEAKLPSILEYVGKLQEVDTSSVDPSAYLTDSVNVFRADASRIVDAATREALLAAFPKRTGDLLQVPGVFES